MIYLKLNKDKTLSYNQTDELYEEEHLSNQISIYLPETIDKYNINSYTILLYIKRDDGKGDIVEITPDSNIVSLEAKHLYNTRNLKVWLTGEIKSTQQGFYTNTLSFKVIPSEKINESPSDPQITYFEQIKKELSEKEVPSKISDLQNDLNYLTKEEVIDIIKTLAYYSPKIEEGSE